MPKANINHIEIEYETVGKPDSKPILLIAGLGSQLLAWSDDVCNELVDNDFFVIKFDNRDVGLSTKFNSAGIPDMMEISAAYTRGEIPDVPYTLEDMANDVVGLINALNIDRVHLCGASMGGMIAQIVAYRYPSRVLSLNVIMSTTGNPSLPQANPEVMAQFFAPIPSEREAYIEEMVKRDKLIYGDFNYDENKAREYRTNEYDRSYYPEGIARQMAAMAVPGNIQPKISAIKAPTLVIHGREDPFNSVEAGKEIASTIPGAELLLFDGMGHSIPNELLKQIVDAISINSKKIKL
jgi:pimeloyl-ACP methyl ester carboxylesterase